MYSQCSPSKDEERVASSKGDGENGFKPKGDRKTTAQAPKDTMFHVDYTDTEIKDVIKDFSERWGLNVLIDPKISGKITIIAPKPVTRDAA